jgi:shikimate dehydrogenase
MTDKYAVIGNPISHSKSPLIHKLFAEQTGQDMSYEAIEAPLDGFAATVQRLRDEGYKGCNVTVPFKFEAFQLATLLTPLAIAELAQTVNTLKFDGDTILGNNTDGTGLVRDIRFNLGIELNNKRVLLIGAGGAADGVTVPLGQAGAKLTIVNRTLDKAQALAARASSIISVESRISVCGFDELVGHQFDVVINATSSGLSDEMPPLPGTNQIPPSPPFSKGGTFSSPFEKGGLRGIFAPDALAYDMMYGRETPFMAYARKQGAAVVADGLGMLVEQAAEAFFLWRNVRPDTKPVLDQLRK